MTKLLVSVRNADEAKVACECGVDVVDFKEPRAGSLGAVSAEVLQAALTTTLPYRQRGRPSRTSAAMGELSAWEATRCSMPSHLPVVDYAKIGIAATRVEDLAFSWNRWRDSLAKPVKGVMVAYADYREASSPQIKDVLDVAIDVQAAGLLIDTYHKTSRNLFDYVDAARIRSLTERAHRAELFVALAGGLVGKVVSEAANTGADVIAVRGAACDDGREGRLSMNKIRSLQARLRQAAK